MKVTIALTPGDYNSIGPEVLLKSIAELKESRFILVSPPEWIDEYASRTGLPNPFSQPFTDKTDLGYWWPSNQTSITPNIQLGSICENCGILSMQCVDHAISLCLREQAHAMVTGPISKEAIALGGYDFPGHTEFLAFKTLTDAYTMMLVRNNLRVGLVTTHIPVSRIAQELNQDKIVEKLTIMNKALIQRFIIKEPRIAVLALNPHGGDGGIMGTEEISIIRPAIQQALANGILCEGPFPADGWFGSGQRNEYDAVLAMYHDQGLAPFKALSFGGGVNFTAGLPIIRTSPDHGTAFGLAGKNSADSSSMKEAIQLAIQMASNN
jgi:4-hydroxythreonine-4-phosphate dehydrogenase